MNLTKLKNAEKKFLRQYPGGFNHTTMQAIGKKHPIDSITTLIKESLKKTTLTSSPLYYKTTLEFLSKIISRSSLISMFEKPKFKSWTQNLSLIAQQYVVEAYKELLLGSQEIGFNTLLDILREDKLARWSLISAFAFYYNPKKEVFIKPSTTKNIINFFELEKIEYKPAPTYTFYKKYRNIVTKMKKQVDSSLSPNNAAFTGFLMMSMVGETIVPHK